MTSHLGGINKHPGKIEELNLPLLYIIYKCEEGNKENKEERNKIPVIIRRFIYPCLLVLFPRSKMQTFTTLLIYSPVK